jgi:hypothetical protein
MPRSDRPALSRLPRWLHARGRGARTEGRQQKGRTAPRAVEHQAGQGLLLLVCAPQPCLQPAPAHSPPQLVQLLEQPVGWEGQAVVDHARLAASLEQGQQPRRVARLR